LRRSCLCCEFVFQFETSGEVPRQELLDAGAGVIGDALKDVVEIEFRVEAVELG
jgi:hypothetical protein